jgi:hypothetical protein
MGPGDVESTPSSMRAALSRPPLTQRPASTGTRSVAAISTVFIEGAAIPGNRDLRSASAPETCGADIDVPLESPYRSPGSVLRICTPGAKRSTPAGPKLEKLARSSVRDEAATAMTFGSGKLAG